jgi:hypothetical protein
MTFGSCITALDLINVFKILLESDEIDDREISDRFSPLRERISNECETIGIIHERGHAISETEIMLHPWMPEGKLLIP